MTPVLWDTTSRGLIRGKVGIGRGTLKRFERDMRRGRYTGRMMVVTPCRSGPRH